MDSRVLLLLLAIAGASNALFPAQLRHAFKFPQSSRVSPELLQNTNGESGAPSPGPSGPDSPGPGDPDFPWELECPSVIEIFNYMNSNGCLDENTEPIGNHEFGPPVNVSEFCSTCDASKLRDMASAVDESCYYNSFLMEHLRMIIPVYGAICTESTTGEFCAAPLFLTVYGDDLATEEEEIFAFTELCRAECPYLETMLNHSFDCFPTLTLFGSVCVQDAGRYCVDTLSDVFYDHGGEMEPTHQGPPMESPVERFCRDPCGGAQVEFWSQQTIPDCRTDFFETTPDPSTLCIRREQDNVLCSALLEYATPGALYACDLNGTASDWTCENDCLQAVQEVTSALGCCTELYLEHEFHPSMLSDLTTWLANTCNEPISPEQCYDDYTLPADRPECAAIRDQGFYSVMDTIRCMVEARGLPGQPTATPPAPVMPVP